MSNQPVAVFRWPIPTNAPRSDQRANPPDQILGLCQMIQDQAVSIINRRSPSAGPCNPDNVRITIIGTPSGGRTVAPYTATVVHVLPPPVIAPPSASPQYHIVERGAPAPSIGAALDQLLRATAPSFQHDMVPSMVRSGNGNGNGNGDGNGNGPR